MSKNKKNRDRRSNPPAQPPRPIAYTPLKSGPITYTTTLKPRPTLLLILSIIFAIWVATLTTLYFTTVYPYRHQRTLPTSVDNPP